MFETSKNKISLYSQCLNKIGDSFPDGFALFDSAGKLMDVNKLLCGYLGYEKEELLKLNTSDFALYDKKQSHHLYLQLQSNREGVNLEQKLKNHDGIEIPVKTKFSLIVENEEIRIIAFIRKQNEDDRYKVAPELTQFALDNAGNPTFWYTASNPKFFYVNKAACEYLEYNQEELLNMSAADINPNYSEKMQSNILLKIGKKNSLLFETNHRSKSGKIIPVEVLVKMVNFEGEDYIISFVRDVTARKQAENELQQAKERAIQANKFKSTFLANMSHEIRTPLTAIIGFAGTARHKNKTPEQQDHALDAIRSSGDHLLHLINDILDLSKIESGEMDIDIQHVNIIQLLTEIENMLIGQAKKKSLEFYVDYQFPLLKIIKTDALRLKQILLNLCNNAIKFTDQGFVKITLRVDQTVKQIIFQVHDSGIGLDQVQIEKIFLPFKQADASTTRRYGGTGLGLSLSNNLANLLGGELSVTSQLNKGSVFQLILPLSEIDNTKENQLLSMQEIETNAESVIQENEMQQLSGRVLLAEDEVLNQELITMYLEDMGLDVEVADNGKVAVQMAKNNNYDLIYLDMQMPEMSGLEALIELRQDNYVGSIVMLTANATKEDRELCKNSGANDFVTKPIDDNLFYKVTAHCLK